LKKDKAISVYFVQPYSIAEAFTTFQNRERQFDSKYFFKTHSGSRNTFLFLLQKYISCKSFKFHHVISKIEDDGSVMYYIFNGDTDGNKNLILKRFNSMQLTENEIIEIISNINI
jgi:hypothetical protein